jgi:hypothetical protein
VFVLNLQPTLPAPKSHVSLLPDNLPCFAKRKARHLKKLETIQRRLAWPPRRDDTANTEMVPAFCFPCTVHRFSFPRSCVGSRTAPFRLRNPHSRKSLIFRNTSATSFDAPLHHAAHRVRCFGIMYHDDTFTRSSRHPHAACCFQQLIADAI